MEYLPGGDLYNLMARNYPFTEDNIQFYLAEITCALNALHTLGFVHRDIKPENVLLDRLGHLKLTDFGSAAVIGKDGYITSDTPIGTPDYIAPELLQCIQTNRPMRTTYNVIVIFNEKRFQFCFNFVISLIMFYYYLRVHHQVTCDFWSMGIIAFEMLTGKRPFASENIHHTYAQILSYANAKSGKHIDYDGTPVSDNLRDLIERLIIGMDHRLTYDKIKRHKFFSDIDWKNIRGQVPPIIPVNTTTLLLLCHHIEM